MAQSALDLTLDRASDVPLGTQLAWKLRGAIVSGRLRPGDRLPGLRDLAERADVNVNTVRAVLARLADQGLIVSEHGRGTFVAEVAGQEELARAADRAARDARLSGVDPRELAALLYAGAGAGRPEAEARHELREAIERLEIERAEIEVELAAIDEPHGEAPPPPRPRRPGAPGARILSADELEATRAALAEAVGDLRRRLSLARERRGTLPVQTAEGAQTVTAPGTWKLRW